MTTLYVVKDAKSTIEYTQDNDQGRESPRWTTDDLPITSESIERTNIPNLPGEDETLGYAEGDVWA